VNIVRTLISSLAIGQRKVQSNYVERTGSLGNQDDGRVDSFMGIHLSEPLPRKRLLLSWQICRPFGKWLKVLLRSFEHATAVFSVAGSAILALPELP